MSSYPAPRLFTFQEYLRIERAAQEKSEFVDGHIYAMAGGSLRHSQISMNAGSSLHNRLKGSRCTVNGSDLRIVPSKTGASFYPDVSVFCGRAAHADSRTDSLMNPTVIVEVLSPSTEGYDRRVKLPRHQDTPSVVAILLISHDKIDADHYCRETSGEWKHSVLTSALDVVDLMEACGTGLPVAEIYDQVTM